MGVGRVDASEQPSTTLRWVRVNKDSLQLVVDRNLYTDAVIFRTCYLFTDRCYLFLSLTAQGEISVAFRAKQAQPDLDSVAGEFGNELINQKIRAELAEETKLIRELIVTQAFAEADLDSDKDS